MKQLEGSTIKRNDTKGWEVKVARLLIREVEDVPGFVARMVN